MNFIINNLKNIRHSKIFLSIFFVLISFAILFIFAQRFASVNNKQNLKSTSKSSSSNKLKKEKFEIIVGEKKSDETQEIVIPEKKTVTAAPVIPVKKSANFIVCIDPGHQRRGDLSLEPIAPGSSKTKPKVTGGATGITTRTPEYEITLKISILLKNLLESKGIKVVMTRTTNEVNVSNIERAQIANKAKVNLFVRIHADGSTDSSVNGISALYPANSSLSSSIYSESKKAAELIQESLVRDTGRKDNGIKQRSDLSGFNWSKVPVILVESGFLSNREEDLRLNTSDEQKRIAQGITEGITKFMSLR